MSVVAGLVEVDMMAGDATVRGECGHIDGARMVIVCSSEVCFASEAKEEIVDAAVQRYTRRRRR